MNTSFMSFSGQLAPKMYLHGQKPIWGPYQTTLPSGLFLKQQQKFQHKHTAWDPTVTFLLFTALWHFYYSRLCVKVSDAKNWFRVYKVSFILLSELAIQTMACGVLEELSSKDQTLWSNGNCPAMVFFNRKPIGAVGALNLAVLGGVGCSDNRWFKILLGTGLKLSNLNMCWLKTVWLLVCLWPFLGNPVLCLHVCKASCDVGSQGTARMRSLFSMLRLEIIQKCFFFIWTTFSIGSF